MSVSSDKNKAAAKWVKCSERLPRDGWQCWVFCPECGVFFAEWWEEDEQWFDNSHMPHCAIDEPPCAVTHWQPADVPEGPG